MERALGCQYSGSARPTSPNHKCKRYIAPSAQPRDCGRAFQGCRVTFNLGACDLARDIHGVHRELTTTIPSWQGWHKRKTFKAPGYGLAFLFGMERDRRYDRDKPTRRACPALDDGLAPTASKDFGSLRGLDRKSTRLNSSHSQISYAVFCLKKKNNQERRVPRWKKTKQWTNEK